jgi:SHAQKYF class myb-like DNA-binding protein
VGASTDLHSRGEKKEGTRHWTKQEHARFVEGMKQWPTTWKAIAAVVQTRSHDQCKSHAQKFPALKSASPQ